MIDVDAAELTVRNLLEKRGQVAARVEQITDERKSLAFAAHADGDVKARKRLDALSVESANISGELESLDAAIAEANSRLEAARRDSALEADQANARELRTAIGSLASEGHKLDTALAAFVTAANGFRDALNAVHSLGCDFPSHGLADANARLAVGTALMQTPWKREFDHLAPHQRRSFAELVDGWVERIEAGIKRRLGETDMNEETA